MSDEIAELHGEIATLRQALTGVVLLNNGLKVFVVTLAQMLDRRGLVEVADIVGAIRGSLADPALARTRADCLLLDQIAAELEDWKRAGAEPDLH